MIFIPAASPSESVAAIVSIAVAGRLGPLTIASGATMVAVSTRAGSRRTPVVPPPYFAGGSGEPMVLLHGFTDTWQGWTRVLPLLTPHHAVFAPTLPGHFGGPAFDPGVAPTTQASLDL